MKRSRASGSFRSGRCRSEGHGPLHGRACAIRIALFTLLMALLFCGSASAAARKLSKKNLTVKTGSTKVLKLKNNKKKEKKVTWKVNKPAVLRLEQTDNNTVKLTGLKPGKAIVRARVNKKTFKCSVTVKKAQYLSVTDITLTAGEKAGVMLHYGTKKGTKWSTSNGSVATCSMVQAKSIKISTWKEGKADITATYKGKKYVCHVTVKPAPEPEEPLPPEQGGIAPNTPYVRPDQPDRTPGDRAAAFCERIATDNHYGYDNRDEYRWGVRQGDRADFDCSSMVITAYEKAGIPVRTRGAVKTYNMYSVFKACGFQDVTSQVNLMTGEGLLRGDVVLRPGKHTEIYLGNGNLCGGRGNAGTGHAENWYPGDQTGVEIVISGYFNFPWKYVLRYGSGSAIS